VRINGVPGTRLANSGPLPLTIPFPFVEYGVLKTESGKPVRQNQVCDNCHPFTARPEGPRSLSGN
jgi:hypothetical protein